MPLAVNQRLCATGSALSVVLILAILWCLSWSVGCNLVEVLELCLTAKFERLSLPLLAYCTNLIMARSFLWSTGCNGVMNKAVSCSRSDSVLGQCWMVLDVFPQCGRGDIYKIIYEIYL